MKRSPALVTTVAVVATLTAALFWGLSGIATKLLFRDAHLDAAGFLAARGFWCLPLFLLLAFFARPARLPNAADWRLLVTNGIFYGPVACGFLAYGAMHTSGTHVSLLLSLIPPVTAVAGALLLRERVAPLRIVALAIGLAGAALLATTRSATGSSLGGDLLLLVQIVGSAATFILTRMLSPRYNAFFLSGVYGAIGTAMLAVLAVLAGGGPTIVRVTADPVTAWWFFGEIVIGLSIYAQFAQSYALRTLGAGTTSALACYGSLVIGIVGALLLLGERISAVGIVAGVLIAIALGLAIVPSRRAAVPEAAAANPESV